VTRAKNAVVFFDSDLQSHAPFYYLLARLGLARVVPGTLKLEVSGGCGVRRAVCRRPACSRQFLGGDFAGAVSSWCR
jgi:hypothetical protein